MRTTRWPETCCGWVLRHGESVGNAQGLVQGRWLDAPLTPRGLAQAREVAGSLPLGLRPRVVSSDLLRARVTAGAIAKRAGATVESSGALRERGLGMLEGSPWSLVDPATIGIRDGVVADPDAAPDGGESIRQFVARVLDGLTPLATAHGTGAPVVVVAHGGVARVTSAVLAGLPTDGDRLLGLAWPAMRHTTPLSCCFADLATRAGTDVLCRTR